MKDFLDCLSAFDLDINDRELALFEKYYENLILWNARFNLTSITERKEVFLKHFADSIALLKYTDVSGKYILDVGTGAGFPGIPIKIMCDDCNVVLLDSLNKRISFLNDTVSLLGLSGITAIHQRAEDAARDNRFREKFDVVVSRAVAGLNTLSEYCLPFVNINGLFISYKSGNVDAEEKEAENAINVLGGNIERTEKFLIPGTDYNRSLVFIRKVSGCKKAYPRKAGTPSRKPL